MSSRELRVDLVPRLSASELSHSSLSVTAEVAQLQQEAPLAASGPLPPALVGALLAASLLLSRVLPAGASAKSVLLHSGAGLLASHNEFDTGAAGALLLSAAGVIMALAPEVAGVSPAAAGVAVALLSAEGGCLFRIKLDAASRVPDSSRQWRTHTSSSDVTS